MDMPTPQEMAGFGTLAARPSRDRRSKADTLTRWSWVLSGALVIQLGVAIWVLIDVTPNATAIAAVAIALAAPIAALVHEAFSKRRICALCSTSTLALLWLTQTGLLLSLQACGPITVAFIGGFGAAVLLFVLCPLLIWPVEKPSRPIHESYR